MGDRVPIVKTVVDRRFAITIGSGKDVKNVKRKVWLCKKDSLCKKNTQKFLSLLVPYLFLFIYLMIS